MFKTAVLESRSESALLAIETTMIDNPDSALKIFQIQYKMLINSLIKSQPSEVEGMVQKM